MRFRKLRIAWSVSCAVVAVLLMVLWVRSFWTIDLISRVNVPADRDNIRIGKRRSLLRTFRFRGRLCLFAQFNRGTRSWGLQNYSGVCPVERSILFLTWSNLAVYCPATLVVCDCRCANWYSSLAPLAIQSSQFADRDGPRCRDARTGRAFLN